MADLAAPDSTPPRSRKGGRKAGPLAEKQRHVVSVRLTDAEHERLFSFLLDNEHEVVNVRASASGPRPDVAGATLESGEEDASKARVAGTPVWVDGASTDAGLYDRGLLLAGNVVPGPAVITEMDSTTLVLPGHSATVHPSGCLLIRPTEG